MRVCHGLIGGKREEGRRRSRFRPDSISEGPHRPSPGHPMRGLLLLPPKPQGLKVCGIREVGEVQDMGFRMFMDLVYSYSVVSQPLPDKGNNRMRVHTLGSTVS